MIKSTLEIKNTKRILLFIRSTDEQYANSQMTIISKYFERQGINSTEYEKIGLKKGNPQADTSVLELEIDQMVYKLYNLTEDEIGIIENR